MDELTKYEASLADRLRKSATSAGVRFMTESELRDLEARRARRIAELRLVKQQRTNARRNNIRSTAPVRSSCPPEHDYEHSVIGPDVKSAGKRQNEFVASGKADSANARMIEFFEHQLRTGGLNKWFSRNLLETICENSLINNRAIDCRPHFHAMGFHIDNDNIDGDGLGTKRSHYRICRIEDAIGLSISQKNKLISEQGVCSKKIKESL